MAKRHLNILTRELTNLFTRSEKVYSDFALATQDMIIDDDTMRPLLLQKVKLDNILSTYSTAIRAAKVDKLQDLFAMENRVQNSFATPLVTLLDNLAQAPEDETVQRLIKEYNAKIHSSVERGNILKSIKFYKDIPNRAPKSKKYLLKHNITDLSIAIDRDMTSLISKQIAQLEESYTEFLNTPIEQTDKGDLDE